MERGEINYSHFLFYDSISLYSEYFSLEVTARPRLRVPVLFR